jgi:SHOCT-like domain
VKTIRANPNPSAGEKHIVDEERKRILKMIEEGKLSAEEGARLLEALDAPTEKATRVVFQDSYARRGSQIRIRIYSEVTGAERVNLTVPIALAKMFSAMVPEPQRAWLDEQGIRIEDLMASIESGQVGKIIDMRAGDHEEHVEVSIE